MTPEQIREGRRLLEEKLDENHHGFVWIDEWLSHNAAALLDAAERAEAAERDLAVARDALRLASAIDAERDALRAALSPFAHDDLCKELGGNVEGDASIIFQRNLAQITLGDCRRARMLLNKTAAQAWRECKRAIDAERGKR